MANTEDTPPADYDEAWKELLDLHLPEFLRCFFPVVAAAIDWKRPFEFLDQELREVIHDTAVQSFRVDRLVKVFRTDGEEEWLLVHLEIQSFRESGFAERIYHYNHSIHRAWGRQPVSLVVLADLNPDWRPCEYANDDLGCETRFRFPACKLLDELPRLEKERSLPAIAARAQIEALRTSGDPEGRFDVRWRLTRSLYEHGYSKEEIREAYRVLSWMMRLPQPMQLTFRQRVVEFEQREKMPYITDIEEIGMAKGLEKGREEGREEGRSTVADIALVFLERTCGSLTETQRGRVKALPLGKVKELSLAAMDFTSPSELDAWLDAAAQD